MADNPSQSIVWVGRKPDSIGNIVAIAKGGSLKIGRNLFKLEGKKQRRTSATRENKGKEVFPKGCTHSSSLSASLPVGDDTTLTSEVVEESLAPVTQSVGLCVDVVLREKTKNGQ